jgi:hypothetical protein
MPLFCPEHAHSRQLQGRRAPNYDRTSTKTTYRLDRLHQRRPVLCGSGEHEMRHGLDKGSE